MTIADCLDLENSFHQVYWTELNNVSAFYQYGVKKIHIWRKNCYLFGRHKYSHRDIWRVFTNSEAYYK